MLSPRDKKMQNTQFLPSVGFYFSGETQFVTCITLLRGVISNHDTKYQRNRYWELWGSGTKAGVGRSILKEPTLTEPLSARAPPTHQYRTQSEYPKVMTHSHTFTWSRSLVGCSALCDSIPVDQIFLKPPDRNAGWGSVDRKNRQYSFTVCLRVNSPTSNYNIASESWTS